LRDDRLKMKSHEFEAKLLETLQDARFGVSISKLAERMDCSRTTVSKYLKTLEEKQLVVQQDIGQYKLWLHIDHFRLNQSRKDALSAFYEPFYDSIMRHLPQFMGNPAMIKQLGRAIASDLAFSEMAQEMVETRRAAVSLDSSVDLSTVAQITMEIFDSIFHTFDTYTWSPPIVMNDKQIFILRMAGSAYSHLPAHFQLIAGVLEAEIEVYSPVEVKVGQILEEEKIVDLIFHLNH